MFDEREDGMPGCRTRIPAPITHPDRNCTPPSPRMTQVWPVGRWTSPQQPAAAAPWLMWELCTSVRLPCRWPACRGLRVGSIRGRCWEALRFSWVGIIPACRCSQLLFRHSGILAGRVWALPLPRFHDHGV